MKISKEGINLIKKYEGLRLKAYKPVQTEQYWTIGYGHYGADVKQGMVISQAYAEKLLKDDIIKFENAVNSLKRNWTQNQFDALTSFAYNCGAGNLKKLVQNRNTQQIADAILLYNKGGGKVLAGLVKRRKEERELFLKQDTPQSDEDELIAIAQEVIDGRWGNGAVRKRKLYEAGYDYARIQTLVNKLLTGN